MISRRQLFPLALPLLLAAALPAAAQKRATPPFKTTLTGNIGDKTATLHLTRTTNGEIAGDFFFHAPDGVPFVPEIFFVEGKADAKGVITLKELGDNPKTTGTFTGTMAQTRAYQFKGTWLAPGRKERLPFALMEEGRYDVNMAHKSKTEKLRKPKFEMDVAWPSWGNAAFDKAVSEKPLTFAAKFKKEVIAEKDPPPFASGLGSYVNTYYDVIGVTPRLVSVRHLTNFYYAGAAHPSSFWTTLTWDRQQNRPVRLGELFKPGVDYLGMVAKMSRVALKKNWSDPGSAEWIDSGAAPKANLFRSWNVAPYGLHISFDVYQVGPYAVGPQEVIIPWVVLKSILNPDGPAAAFWVEKRAGPTTKSTAEPAAPQETKSETVTTASGLKYEDLKIGTGAEAKAGQRVTVHYTGTLLNGEKFNSSLDRQEPFTFSLGGGEVIKGWDEGVAGMKVGGKRKLTIPASLAYGEGGVGPIPPSATLLFEVELLKVE